MRNKIRLPLKIAGLTTIIVALIAGLGFITFRGADRVVTSTAPDRAPAADAFTPTREQADGFRMATVADVAMRSEEVTDGLIVTNDNATVSVFSPYSGRVSKVIARLGDSVRKGDALMAVEASEFVQGQNDLISATSALGTARTQSALADKAENRQHELFLAKAGAQKDWLQSQADAVAAKNAARSAEIALSAVRNRLRILGRTEQQISRLEAEPNTLSLQAEATVAAPITGTVVQKQVGPGQFIQSAAAGAALAQYAIADLSTVWMIGNLREANVAMVHLGQSVEVRVLAYPDRIFSGKVTWISPSIDPLTHRLPVRAQIDNTDGALKPQMFASFTVITASAAKVSVIPQAAVIYEGSTTRVFVARSDGSIQGRVVRLGRQNGDNVEVLGGLVTGERVVISGALFIDRAIKASAA